MALAPDQWREIASGDSTSVPQVQLAPGGEYAIEIDLPVAVPDALAAPLAAALRASLGAFWTVTGVAVAGATVRVEIRG